MGERSTLRLKPQYEGPREQREWFLAEAKRRGITLTKRERLGFDPSEHEWSREILTTWAHDIEQSVAACRGLLGPIDFGGHMPTATDRNGHGPASQVPAAVTRPWAKPIYEYAAVEPVPVNLGGVERGLLFTNAALKTVQRETGKNPFDGQQWDELSREPDGLAILLRAGLLHENPDLTIEEVDGWVLLPRIGYYRERLWYAYRDAMPDPEPVAEGAAAAEANDDPNPASAPTG